MRQGHKEGIKNMGTWGAKAFENDSASDWIEITLEGVSDVTPLKAAIHRVLTIGHSHLLIDPHMCWEALAACESLAWLTGKPAPCDADTTAVEAWVDRVDAPPEPELVADALAAIEIVRAPESGLSKLWAEVGMERFSTAVNSLADRLRQTRASQEFD